MAVTALVLADTHIRADGRRTLPAGVREQAAAADVILHAGDVVSGHVLDELATFAPVHAVLGNNDVGLADRLPGVVELTLDGVHAAMVHDSGPRQGRAARLHRRFPAAHVVVFGHSHEPLWEPGDAGQWLCNPGSPIERRRQPHHTCAVLRFDHGTVRHELVIV